MTKRWTVGVLACLVAAAPVGAQSAPEARAVADRLIESLGGSELWASARAIYIRETAYPANVAGPLTAEFWRDLERPVYRSWVRGSGTDRETRWSEAGGWTIRNGVRTEMSAETLAEEVAGWAQEPYVMYHRLAVRDPALHLVLSGERRLEIYDGEGGPILCWFDVDVTGALLRWGNYYQGEVSEHVYGPLRELGAFRMPRWGTATSGSWRFEYEEVRVLTEPIDLGR